jgi:hypothetical protein
LTDKAGFSLSAAGIQAIWDALTSALTTATSIGKLLVDNINATISSRASQTSLDTLDDFVDTEVNAIKLKTDNLPADPADASDIASSFTTVNTKLDTIDDFLDLEVAAIKAKTDNLPTDPADQSLVEAAITTATSPLSTLTQANVRTAIGLASANLDTQLDALPTNAELATALATADDAILAAIALLNNLSASQVNAEVVDALATDVIADSVAADGTRPTIAQAVLMITRFLMEKSVSGTTVTVKKEDGSTTSMTFTLDSASTPTSITRS